jgi:hypothetical protein
MMDTRCYNCAENLDKFFDTNNLSEMPKYSYMGYQGRGIFKCPRCGSINDLSKNTYTIKISRFYDEYGELDTEFLELDPKLSLGKAEGIDIFKSDMGEFDIFEDIPVGKYELEVLWYYYECGGYEGEEWDLNIEILSEEELE